MEASLEEPKHLRTLRRLVNTLTIVLIVGFITVVVVFVIRFAGPATPPPELPETITLPNGMTAQALTLGTDWIAVVAKNRAAAEYIFILNLDGSVRDTIKIKAAE